MILTLLLAAFALLGGVVSAQDFPVFCGDLSDDDCTLLTEATETMRGVESAIFHLDFDFAMSGLPDSAMDSINFQIGGDGAFAVDGDALSTLGAFYMSPEDIVENIEELPAMFEEAIQAISADVTLVIEIPPELSELSPTAMPEQVSLSARLVDGFAYVNLDKLAELDTSGSMPRGWQGIDLAGLYRDLLEQQIPSMNGLLSSMTGFGSMSAFTDPEYLATFTTVERLDDSEVDGQAAAAFETTLDYGALFSDPTMLDVMRSSLEGMGGFGGTKPDRETIDMMMNMYATMFDGLELEMTQTVGLDDHYVHQLGVFMDWTPAFGAMMGMSSANMPEMRFVMDVHVDLARFNDAPEISAPEDVTIYPIEGLLSRRGILRGDFGSN
jgi:hypothetical protein